MSQHSLGRKSVTRPSRLRASARSRPDQVNGLIIDQGYHVRPSKWQRAHQEDYSRPGWRWYDYTSGVELGGCIHQVWSPLPCCYHGHSSGNLYRGSQAGSRKWFVVCMHGDKGVLRTPDGLVKGGRTECQWYDRCCKGSVTSTALRPECVWLRLSGLVSRSAFFESEWHCH